MDTVEDKNEIIKKQVGEINQPIENLKATNSSDTSNDQPKKFTRRSQNKVLLPNVDFKPIRKKQNKPTRGDENNSDEIKPQKANIKKFISQDKKSHDYPTGMISDVTLTIHTTQAFSLLVGGGNNSRNESIFKKLGEKENSSSSTKETRNRRFCYSLFSFSANADKVGRAALNGNPFAVKILCELEDRLQVLNEALKESIAFANSTTKDMEELYALKIRPIMSKNPQEIPITVGSNYASALTTFIGGYDILMRQLLALRRSNTITYQDWNEHRGSLSTLYRGCLYPVFNLVDRHLLNISTMDYLEFMAGVDNKNAKKIQTAIKLFGKLEQVYLDELAEPKLLSKTLLAKPN